MSFFKKVFRWIVELFTFPQKQCNIAVLAQPSTPYAVKEELIRDVVLVHFRNFIPYATKHYNAQLDILSQRNTYRARYDIEDMVSLATDYFKRNRNRLFQWWCMNNKNVLTLNEEFAIHRDLIGFNNAFKLMCKKMFDIDIEPDTSYKYGVNVINNDGTVNNSIIELMSLD